MIKRIITSIKVLCACGLLMRTVQAQPFEATTLEKTQSVVAEMHAKKLTPQQAWDKGLLTREIVVMALTVRPLLEEKWGLSNPSEEVLGFAALAVQHAPHLLLKENLPQPEILQLRLGQCLVQQSDARAVDLLEELLAEEDRTEVASARVVAAISWLHRYYARTNQPLKAAEASLKIEEFDLRDEYKSNLTFQAAQVLYHAGYKERAYELYERILNYDYGWTKGHVLTAMAEHLLAEGRTDEAIQLLQRPITGDKSDQIQVLLHNRLARLYFERGEWEQARHWAKAAIEQFQKIKNPVQNHGLEYLVDEARGLQQKIEQWSINPVQVNPEVIEITVDAGQAAEGIISWCHVSSYRAIHPVLTSKDKRITISRMVSPHDDENDKHQQFALTIAPGAVDKALVTDLELTVKEFPEVKIRINLLVTTRKEADEAQE